MSRQTAASTTRRTLHYFWLVTRKHFGLFTALMASTFLFVALLSYGNPYVMSLVVDRVSAGSVSPDEVFAVFGPYILALIGINVAGQVASKVQDYTMYRLQIAASYDLATMSFDALCNQSMSFHSNRFGGTLVSQTTKFMSAYQLLLETITFPFLPVICSVVFTCAILAPRVPVYVAILMLLLAVYAGVSYYMYKRILALNEKAAGAQNQLSGELSDSVANILAVKTYGREDYERGLFDQANREVVARDSKRMWASLTRGIVTACITVAIMSVVAVFIAGGNAWYGITPGTLVVMFTYTYTVTNQFNFINNGLQRFNRAFGDASGMTIILDEPRLVADAPDAAPLEVREGAIDFEELDSGIPTETCAQRCSTGLICAYPQARGLVWWVRAVRAKPRSRSCCCGFPTFRRAASWWTARTSPTPRSSRFAARSPMCRRRRCCSIAALRRTSRTDGPTRPWTRSAKRRAVRTRSSSSSACRRVSIPLRASAASSCRAASASASP